jgi:PAS domain S-box-containing protein
VVNTVNTVDLGRAVRILAVDDNAAALYATSRVLRAAGFEVMTATTGTAALAAAPDADLVVLDINLPDIDGFEVCRRLRASPITARLPVLHLSATFTQAEDRAIGLSAGADSYLTRPVEAPVLIATVRTLLFARRAEELRWRSSERLGAMLRLAPIGVALLDAQLRYEEVNEALCALLGGTREDLVGKVLGEASAHRYDRLLDAARIQLKETGLWQGALPVTRRDATVVHVDWRIAKEKASGGYIIIASDMTARLQQERERERLLESERAARAEAERSNRLKEEFLATLSHELRNPLNAISGWASVLEHVPNLPREVANAAAGIQRNCKLQANMISDLLDYAGITFGKMRIVSRVTPPYHAVRAALDIMQPIADASGVELQSTFEAEHLRVLADPERLQQIVWNLLSNAIKFSAKGAIVRIAAGRRGGNFRLTVEDYGAGISPEFLPRVFDRFSQGDATITRRHAGLGIGLAIVKQLVDMQHGTITAFSEGAGRGAKFTLELPLADVSTAVLGDSQRAQRLSLAGAVVLLVEDDDDARELTSRILQEVGARVIEARNAETALTRVIDGDANVLISDIGMANQDGYQLLREIRRRGYGSKRLPAIALTAFARMEDRESALAAGFQEHLVKPIEGQSLISRIAELLRAP